MCGPAAFFYCLQQDRPDVYARPPGELWRYGKTKIGALTISPERDVDIQRVCFLPVMGSQEY